MIPVNQLVQVFNSMIGWPYVTPGYNDERGIDCSGAFVYAYRQFGESIYHGSNRIIRVYCHDVTTVSSLSQLRVGMAIFKSRTDLSQMKAEYKPGGRYYDPALPYDYYHMGLVTSVSPLRIVNATPPVTQVNTLLSPWCCAGYLNAVDYSGEEEKPEEEKLAVVLAESGSTVNLRAEPSLNAPILTRVPIGRRVILLDRTNDEWSYLTYEAITGYMMSEFVRELC